MLLLGGRGWPQDTRRCRLVRAGQCVRGDEICHETRHETGPLEAQPAGPIALGGRIAAGRRRWALPWPPGRRQRVALARGHVGTASARAAGSETKPVTKQVTRADAAETTMLRPLRRPVAPRATGAGPVGDLLLGCLPASHLAATPLGACRGPAGLVGHGWMRTACRWLERAEASGGGQLAACCPWQANPRARQGRRPTSRKRAQAVGLPAPAAAARSRSRPAGPCGSRSGAVGVSLPSARGGPW
jgi:hypothetical protein